MQEMLRVERGKGKGNEAIRAEQQILSSNCGADTCGVLQIVGFALALVAVVLATFFASTEASSFNAGGTKSEGSLDYPPDFFHCVYMLASAYVGMLFVGWSLQNVPGKLTVDSGWISCWFHMATQWLSFLLYTWILVAPRLLKNREFGHL